MAVPPSQPPQLATWVTRLAQNHLLSWFTRGGLSFPLVSAGRDPAGLHPRGGMRAWMGEAEEGSPEWLRVQDSEGNLCSCVQGLARTLACCPQLGSRHTQGRRGRERGLPGLEQWSLCTRTSLAQCPGWAQRKGCPDLGICEVALASPVPSQRLRFHPLTL